MSDRTGVPNAIPNRYVGPHSDIVPIKRFPRRPLTTDKKYPIGQLAILGPDPSTGSQGELWYLSKFSGGDAIWLQFGVGAGQPGIDFILTDDGAPAVGPDGDGIVTLTGGTGIVTSGQDPSTTVTIDVTSAVATSYATDSGTAVPAANVLTIAGGAGITTSGSGSTVTIDIDNWTNVTSFTPTVDGSSSGSVTVTTATGVYARVGPLVILQFELAWGALGGASGDVVLGGFPVASQGAFNREPLGNIWIETLALPAGKTYALLEIPAGTTTGSLWGIGTATTPSKVQILANSNLHGTIAYVKTSA